MKFQRQKNGFTIIELLIVIVVIGVLAVLAITSLSTARVKADNASRQAEILAWRKAFEAYKASYGDYPAQSNGGYCLGTGSPNGYCRNYDVPDPNFRYAESASTGLLNELQKVSQISPQKRTAINGLIGPYVMYFPNDIVIQHVFSGTSGDCPRGSSFAYTDNAGMVICDISLKR